MKTLKKVIEKSSTNKMVFPVCIFFFFCVLFLFMLTQLMLLDKTPENLAIVLSPNVLYSKEVNAFSLVDDLNHANGRCAFLD